MTRYEPLNLDRSRSHGSAAVPGLSQQYTDGSIAQLPSMFVEAVALVKTLALQEFDLPCTWEEAYNDDVCVINFYKSIRDL